MTKARGQALGSIFGEGARPSRAAPATPAVPPSVAAFLQAVDRVEEAVEAETAALAGGLDADLAAFGNRKRQGLLELDRALRAATAAAGPRAEMRERLARFAAKLERNRAALGTQLRAAREIADILAQTLRDAESDGTYAPAAAGRA